MLERIIFLKFRYFVVLFVRCRRTRVYDNLDIQFKLNTCFFLQNKYILLIKFCIQKHAGSSWLRAESYFNIGFVEAGNESFSDWEYQIVNIGEEGNFIKFCIMFGSSWFRAETYLYHRIRGRRERVFFRLGLSNCKHRGGKKFSIKFLDDFILSV